jgi:hypothetical protein
MLDGAIRLPRFEFGSYNGKVPTEVPRKSRRYAPSKNPRENRQQVVPRSMFPAGIPPPLPSPPLRPLRPLPSAPLKLDFNQKRGTERLE